MGNTLKRFLITFFSMTLWIFIFINFLGWSGLAPNMAFGFDNGNWGADRYFGYSSFMSMVGAFNSIQDSQSFFSGAQIFDTLKHIASVAIGNIPQIIGSIQNYINNFGQGGIVDAIFNAFNVSFNILQLFLQPLAMIIWSIYLTIQVTGFIVQILAVLIVAIGGTFNQHFPDINSGGIDWSSYFIWSI